MTDPSSNHTIHGVALQRVPTGINGLDEILNGGFPKGRPTLVCGGPGCGKTLLAMEFLARGATLYNEPGVFMSFEESSKELGENFFSMGVDLEQLIRSNKINVDYVHVERAEIEETGEYDLEGLFIRLNDAIDTIGAKRVVLDTIESLFSGFSNENVLRSELRRLFRWLKDKGVTAIITGERGTGQLTRHGLEEYVSDCVILLDHRVNDGVATRFLRVVKYRGSKHSNNEYPFLINDHGISVIPITFIGLNYPVSNEHITTGVPRLDTMLGGEGYYRGSSILISGTAGSGKTSLAGQFVAAACQRGERCMYFAFEESGQQVTRNLRSIGIDLGQWVDKGLLKFHAVRPTMYAIEMHLLMMQQIVEEFNPSVVVVDPITNLLNASDSTAVKSMTVRLIDYLKMNQVTALFTSLTSGGEFEASTELNISSLMDTWLLMRYLENNGERNRGIYILKSRGMNHTNQIREFRLSNEGIQLLDVYLGTGGILTGSARVAHEAQEKIDAVNRALEIKRKKQELELRQQEISSQIKTMNSSINSIQDELDQMVRMEELRKQMSHDVQAEVALSRRADQDNGGNDHPNVEHKNVKSKVRRSKVEK